MIRLAHGLIAGGTALLAAVMVAVVLTGSPTPDRVIPAEVLGEQLEPATPGARIVEEPSAQTLAPRDVLDLSVLEQFATSAPVVTFATTSITPSTAPATTVVPTTVESTTTAAPTTTVPTTTVPTTTTAGNNPRNLPRPDLSGIGSADSGVQCLDDSDARPAIAMAIDADGSASFDGACGQYVATLISLGSGPDSGWWIVFEDAAGELLATTTNPMVEITTGDLATSSLAVAVPAEAVTVRVVGAGPNAVGVAFTSPATNDTCGPPHAVLLSADAPTVQVSCSGFVPVLVGAVDAEPFVVTFANATTTSVAGGPGVTVGAPLVLAAGEWSVSVAPSAAGAVAAVLVPSS